MFEQGLLSRVIDLINILALDKLVLLKDYRQIVHPLSIDCELFV